MEIGQAPLGAIFDTNSKGRFDLVIYRDGLLGLKGTYVGVALRAAAIGMGAGLGSAAAAGAGAAAGSSAGGSFDARRLARILQSPREELMKAESTFFVPRDSMVGLVLCKRWHGHSLVVQTRKDPAGRKFEWKPALNKFSQVQDLLETTFPGLVTRK